MISSVNLKDLRIQDLVISGLIIFIMSTIIANIYDPLLGITYAFGIYLLLLFWVGYTKKLGVIQRNKTNSKKDKKTTSVFLILKNTLN